MKAVCISVVGMLVVGASVASLVPVGPVPFSGTGIGAVNTVLTVGGKPTESGCVARGPAGDVLGSGACPAGFTGGDERTGASQTQTRTISELGLTTATDLRIVVNVNESIGNIITLDNLVLTIYDPAGNLLFTSGPFTPPTFGLQHLSGTSYGYVFELDTTQAAQAQLVFSPTNRVGLAATLNGTTAGNETFFVADVTAIGVPLFGADLAVTKTAPATAISGTTFSYTIGLTNSGPEAATNAVMSDVLPAGTTFSSIAAPAGWTCTTPTVGTAGTVSCSKATMAVAESATFTLSVRLCPEVSCGTVVSNTATASSATIDPVTANGTASATTTAQAQSDLAIVKSASAAAVNPGGTLIYTLTATNAGPSNSAGTTITDTLPAGFTAASIATSTGSCSGVGMASVSCSIGTIGAPGECTATAPPSVAVTITALASPSILPGTYTDTATVTTANCLSDPNLTNNVSTINTTVPAVVLGADVALTKIASPTTVAGSNLTYTMTVTNSGPDPATNVVITDPLPPETRFVSQTTPAGWSCTAPAIGSTGTITCSKASMAVAEAAIFTTVVRTCPDLTCNTTLTNTATVASAVADPLPANNTSTAVVAVRTQSDLAITKTASTATLAAGDALTYALNVTNAGPSNSAATTIVDTLPAGFTVTTVNTTAGTCTGVGTSTVTCSLGTIGAPAQCATAAPTAALITIGAQVSASATPGTYTNTATVSTGNCLGDPNLANNTATAAAALQQPAANAVNVPTLSQLGIAVFAALLLLAGVYFIRS